MFVWGQTNITKEFVCKTIGFTLSVKSSSVNTLVFCQQGLAEVFWQDTLLD